MAGNQRYLVLECYARMAGKDPNQVGEWLGVVLGSVQFSSVYSVVVGVTGGGRTAHSTHYSCPTSAPWL